ncbi:MAG: hypothetical protein Ct9H300mP11_17580 [Chloroflexota bacterium]|nr:MAG: hypothetical protein Ct9H300mP11_17580 [Chloroflexota bacterium]
MTEIEHRVAVAKRLATNIRDYLDDLTPQQWELPSACAEWKGTGCGESSDWRCRKTS